MSRQTKQELRGVLERCDRSNDFAISTQIVRKLREVLETTAEVRSALLYTPVKKWVEFDISSLPKLVRGVEFETLKNAKDVPFPERKFDVIIIPLLGFNDKGYRLGHGGGWYDRFLTVQSQALKIGVGHEDTLVDFEPEVHDVPMDIILTEVRTRDFR